MKFIVHAIELACKCKGLDLLKLLLGFMNIKMLCWMSSIVNPTPIVYVVSTFKTCSTMQQNLKHVLEFNPHLLNDSGYMYLEHILRFLDSSNIVIDGHSFFEVLKYSPCFMKDTPFVYKHSLTSKKLICIMKTCFILKKKRPSQVATIVVCYLNNVDSQ